MIPSNGRPRTPRRSAAAALICAGLLAGCSGGSSDRADPQPETTQATTPTVSLPALPADRPQRSACGFLSQAEVEAVVGAKVTAGRATAEPTRTVCTFTPVAGASESIAVVAITSSGVPGYFPSARERLSRPQTVVAGDEAVVSGGQGLVRRADTMVAVIVALRRDLPQLAAMATKLVQTIGTHI